MRRRIGYGFILLIALTLSSFQACTSKTETFETDEKSVKVEKEGKQTHITIQTKEDTTHHMAINKNELPGGWPSEVPVLPGGDIVFSQSDAQGKMQQINVETQKSPGEALKFYEEIFSSKGWNIGSSMSMPRVEVLTAEKSGREAMVQVVQDKNKTVIQIIISNNKS